MSAKQYYDVDYESIKSRLKTYLSNQTALKDYNFEGAAISAWIHFLSYVVFYINTVLNFVANELFIATAQMEDNVFKSAYQLNYLPRRKSAPKMTLNVVNSADEDVTISAHTSFMMGQIQLSTIEDYTIPANSSADIIAYEGHWKTYSYTFEGKDFETFKLEDRENIDNDNFALYVNGVQWNHVYQDRNYYLANNYFIRYLLNFEIRFDKDRGFFNIPSEDDLIEVNYLYTNGATYNGLSYSSAFTPVTPFLNSSYLSITSTDYLKDGLDEEECASISQNAPLFYSAGGRCVTEDDYNFRIKQTSLYAALGDMVVYSSHRDYVDYNENPVEILTPSTKIDKGWFIFSGVRRNMNELFDDCQYGVLTFEEQQQIIEYFEYYRFMQVFGKYRRPSIMALQPHVQLKFTRGFDMDKETFELSMNHFMENYIGFNKQFSRSELISFLKSYTFVDYCDVNYSATVHFCQPLVSFQLTYDVETVTYEVGQTLYDTSVAVNTPRGKIIKIIPDRQIIVVEKLNSFNFIAGGAHALKVEEDPAIPSAPVVSVFAKSIIRLFNAIEPGTVSGTGPDGEIISDDGGGALLVDSVEQGYINYNTGYFEIEDVFSFDNQEFISFDVELDDPLNIAVQRETFLDHQRVIVEYL